MNRIELARRIYDISHIKGEFRLRSGQMSNEYFDKYLFEGQPGILKAIARQMIPLMPDGIVALAGLEMGGIPIVTMLSQVTGVPAVFVRKKVKTYGTCKLAEGGGIAGKRILIVEDIVTSGGQILLSAADLRERRAIVEEVVCVIDREAGGADNLRKQGLLLKPLFTMSEVEMAAKG